MTPLEERLNDWVGEVLVIDFISPFVAVGELSRVGSDYVELLSADLHDLRDSDSTRELYLVKVARHGLQKNRERVIIRLAETVAVSRMDDVFTG
jgi:hypothetical protein